MGEISKKVKKRGLKWYGYVVRRYEGYDRETVARMDVEETRRKGRLKRRWMDSVNVDLRVMRMDVEGRRGKGRLKRRWMDSVNVDLRVMRMNV